MKTQIKIYPVFLSTLAALILFVMTAAFSASANATPTEGYQAGATAPITLAYYRWNYPHYGYRYGYRPYWGGRGWRSWGRVCSNRCAYNRWGQAINCVRVCN